MADLWELTKKAKAGNVEAQMTVARAYKYGKGVNYDESAALKWFKMAAEQGDAEGAYQTAKLLPNFLEDVDKDKLNPEVISYLKTAAEKGHVKAQIDYALYQPGYYVPLTTHNIDLEERFFWLTKAAEQDNAEAMRELGMTYYNKPNADHIHTDYEKAVFWLTKAAEKDDAEAKYYLAECYRLERGVEYDAEKLFHLYKEAAEAGFEEAMGQVGVCYLHDIGTEYTEDEEEHAREAVYWFRKGAEHQDPDLESCYQLGLCLLYGTGTEVNEKEALEYFHEAVSWAKIYRTEVPKAEYMLGECYYEGHGTEMDDKEAVYWFEQAAEKNHAKALYMLGECYFYGYGVRTNRKKALKYYHRVVDIPDLEKGVEEDEEASYSLGFCYANGLGTEKNMLKAVYWYSKAEDLGSSEAREELDKILERK